MIPGNSTSLVFAPGVVELSFLISVHQDGEPEPNEYFDLFLDEPWGGARLGAQQRTRITVIDHDSNGSTTDHMLSEWMDASVAVGFGDDRVQAIAGVTSNFTVVSRDALGRERGQGGDVFAVWVEASVGTESEESGVGYGMESLVSASCQAWNGVAVLVICPRRGESSMLGMRRGEEIGSWME